MIGLFDSGAGGLTVLRAIRARAPQANIVYFGDIRNAPYGSKTSDELKELTRAGIAKLIGYGARDVVSACNSASSSFLEGAFHDARFIEMTRPTARSMRLLAGARVLLLATDATVHSRIYNDALDPIVHLESLPLPGLATAIEKGESTERVEKLVRDAFMQKKDAQFDVVLLGCTHYPLVRSCIQKEAETLWGKVLVLDPADAVADEVVQRFDIAGDGRTQFYISEHSDPFMSLAKKLCGATKYAIDVV